MTGRSLLKLMRQTKKSGKRKPHPRSERVLSREHESPITNHEYPPSCVLCALSCRNNWLWNSDSCSILKQPGLSREIRDRKTIAGEWPEEPRNTRIRRQGERIPAPKCLFAPPSPLSSVRVLRALCGKNESRAQALSASQFFSVSRKSEKPGEKNRGIEVFPVPASLPRRPLRKERNSG